MAAKIPGKDSSAQRLRENLVRVQAVRSDADAHPLHAERRRRLKTWQVERLSRTYADLLAHPRYAKPAEFFRSDLYGPKDFRQRDRDLDRLVHVPLLYTSLKMMRQPARLAGLSELQSFLERGFTAFRDMNSADEFMVIIVRRESAFLEKIFAGDPKPFEMNNAQP